MKSTLALAAAALNAIKAKLDGGTLFYFAGPVPAGAGDALNMGSQHTQVVALSDRGLGGGLNFETTTSNVLAKDPGQTWKGLVKFDGAQGGETTLTPTFWRFCPAGDNGRGITSNARLQGTIGGPSSSADIRLGDGTTVTANGTNERALPIFTVTQSFLG